LTFTNDVRQWRGAVCEKGQSPITAKVAQERSASLRRMIGVLPTVNRGAHGLQVVDYVLEHVTRLGRTLPAVHVRLAFFPDRIHTLAK
jgi:hypothetical protein